MLRLHYERLRRGHTQSTLAAAVRLVQCDLSLIENGRLVPTPEQLQRLADAFSIEPAAKLLEHVVVVHAEAVR